MHGYFFFCEYLICQERFISTLVFPKPSNYLESVFECIIDFNMNTFNNCKYLNHTCTCLPLDRVEYIKYILVYLLTID